MAVEQETVRTKTFGKLQWAMSLIIFMIVMTILVLCSMQLGKSERAKNVTHVHKDQQSQQTQQAQQAQQAQQGQQAQHGQQSQHGHHGQQSQHGHGHHGQHRPKKDATSFFPRWLWDW